MPRLRLICLTCLSVSYHTSESNSRSKRAVDTDCQTLVAGEGTPQNNESWCHLKKQIVFLASNRIGQLVTLSVRSTVPRWLLASFHEVVACRLAFPPSLLSDCVVFALLSTFSTVQAFSWFTINYTGAVMSDHCEEQEMEQEALGAIFDDCLEVVSAEQPFKWAISIWPEQHSPEENHVGIKLIANIPLDYPESSLPDLEIELLKGLMEDHRQELLVMAKEEAEANMGMPVIFAVCERLREWLAENNVKGMDDLSMYAQMVRREKEAEKQARKIQNRDKIPLDVRYIAYRDRRQGGRYAKKEQQQYESQKQVEEMTEAEAEQLAIQKRRAEGTPCTRENFLVWKAKFEAEMAEQAEKENQAAAEGTKGKKKESKEKVVDKSGRQTGFLQFSDKTGAFNMEAMEAACDNAQRDEDEEDVDVENEELFDVGDDDLDDLDFEDEDDDESDEEEPDI
eukprot:scaffold5048_cov121-Cylindrotheca_fusiformis.AAC.11